MKNKLLPSQIKKKNWLGQTLTILLLGIFMISFVSALNWDNIKSYNEETREVTITNAFGLGDEIGKARLISPLNVMVLESVDNEKIKVGEFDIWAYEDYSDAIKNSIFTDMKTGEEIEKEFELRYKKIKYIEVDDYEIICKKYYKIGESPEIYDENNCQNTLIGKHEEQIITWEKITFTDLTKDEHLTIGVFVITKKDEYVDWKLTIYGREVEEWATYTVLDCHATGGNKTIDGDYCVHTFLTDDNFTPNRNITNVSVLVVAGGGAGGGTDSNLGGGGAGGGVVEDLSHNVSTGSHAITIGAGGIGVSAANGNNGANSVFSDGANTITAIGGGGGGYGANTNGNVGLTGGCGGGSGANTIKAGGVANQGNSGGGTGYGYNGGGIIDSGGWSGGGGGAGEVGGGGYTATAGDGGDGHVSSINGSSTYYAGGGGGSGTTGGTGGLGGGADGQDYDVGSAENGEANTGGGGGGAGGTGGLGGGNGGSGIVIIRYGVLPDDPPVITLNSPLIDANYTTLQTITFNYTVYDDKNLDNVALYVNDILNQTNSSGLNNTDYLFDLSLGDGDWTIYGRATDNESQETNSSSIRIFIDSTLPTINITHPIETIDYHYIENNETLNWTIDDTNLESCWYNYNGTNTTITCGDNSTSFILEGGVYNLTIYANDTLGNENSSFTEWNYKVFENNRTHNTTSYETAYETYSINVTANSSLTGVTLDFNGTDYTATQSGNIWSYSMDIPLANIGNNSIDWKFTYGGTINSDYTTYQYINYTIFTLCNSTYTDDFLNITFKDESNSNNINASIPTSTFEYYLGSGTVTKTYNYINNTDNYNYRFCATPSRTLHVDPYVQYKRNSDYPQRIWDAVIQEYTSTLSTQVLYLLESADGIYVTLQVINSADQLLSGVDVTATREIESVDTTVAFGTTGSPGTVTFWLNPDFSHDFLFSKTGYTDYETSFTPTQTSYTITMGGGAEVENSTIQGITYSIIPTNSYLENDTSYTFGITLTSSYWDVSDYGFNLRLSNGTIITGDNTGTEGTALTKVYNVSNQSIIYLDYYWVIDGVYTNDTIYWIVHNTENTDWSIAVFFTDLNLYLDSGIYGLDNFGRNLIIFLILFLSVGIMSYKYGATSPLAISSLVFGIIFFFDIVVGLIPTIRGIEHLPTFLAALILTLSIFNEVRT